MNPNLQQKSKLHNAKAKLSELKKKYSKDVSVGITKDVDPLLISSNSEQSQDEIECVDEYVIRQKGNETANRVTTLSNAKGRNTGIKIEINQRYRNGSEIGINAFPENVGDKLKSADSFSQRIISSNLDEISEKTSSNNSIKSELPDQLEHVNLISSSDDNPSFAKSISEINNRQLVNSKIVFCQEIGDVTSGRNISSRSTDSETAQSKLTREGNSKSPQQYIFSTASNSTTYSVTEIEEESDLETPSNETISDVNYNDNLNNKDITSLDVGAFKDPNLENLSVNSQIFPKILKSKTVKDINYGLTLQSKNFHQGAINNASTKPTRGDGSNRSVKDKTAAMAAIVNEMKENMLDKKKCKHTNIVSLEYNQIRRLKPAISTLKTNFNSKIEPTQSTSLNVCDVNTHFQIKQHCPILNELVQTSSQTGDCIANCDTYTCDDSTTQLLKNQIHLIKVFTESQQQMYLYFCQAINMSKM